ncbi:Dps family protein [Haploplasma axanthum]|uniref:DPS protein homolog n=1 Tax=Haploplasma axanthum TaxID=29552 RepID=A0A449BD56_HAPAX|nr:DNA starvation/stationary phase protection protein [Haploplasma axanthum]VEU80240.1 DPS protein homolog [Haploplasma axanthum]
MEKLYTFLNKEVANFSVLFTKLHHHHWYVKGPNFFSLHVKFEEFYDEINELYDEFAERLLTIGGEPISNMKGYLKAASLDEVNDNLTSEQMVKMIHDDFVLIADELKQGIVIAQDLHDETTADLFISTVGKLEKHAWMLKFYLSK